MRFHNGTNGVDVRILPADKMDYFVAKRVVWESLKIGAYAELEGTYWMICIKQGSRVGTIGGCWRCIHVSFGRAGLDLPPQLIAVVWLS